MKRTVYALLTGIFICCALSGGAQSTVAYIGTGTTTNANTNYPAPYGQWYTCSKHQMLVLASELLGAGLSPGFITSLGFNVAVPNGVALQDFTVKIKLTAATSITAFDNTGLTTVYGPFDYVDVAGWNIHNFNPSFFWDGASNVLVETCFCNGTSNYTYNAQMYNSNSGFSSTAYTITDGDASHCVNAVNPVAVFDRPNMRFETFTPYTTDAGIVSITPPADGCTLSAAENVTVSVQNFGTDTIFSLDVYCRLDGGAPVMEVITDTLVLGSPLSYTFGATFDLSLPGIHTLDAWTDLLNDSVPANDSVTGVQVEHFASVPAFPVSEDFETQTACPEICGSACTIAGDWENDAGADIDWTVDAGGTPTNGTGPLADHTTGTATGKYIFTASSGCSNAEAILSGPCIDFDSLANPVFSCHYHMYGAAIGALYLEYDSGGVWVELTSVAGQQQTGQSDPWTGMDVDLSALTGITKLRIRAVTGPGTTSDIAVDDIMIFDNVPDDVGITAVMTPKSGCDLAAAEPVTVTIKNYGLNTQNTIPVAYSLDGGPAVMDTAFGSQATFSSTNFTFAVPADLSTPGAHNIDAWTMLGGDGVATNDSSANYLVENAAGWSTFPFTYTIDTEPACVSGCGSPCALQGAWENLLTDDIDWTVDAGGTSSSNTGPAVDHTTGLSSGKYLYTEASGCSFVEAILQSPCLNLDTMAFPALNFSYHMYGGNMGELHVEIDSAGTWVDIFTKIGQVQTADTDPWAIGDVDLSAYAGVTKLRIRGITGAGITSDMAIDDILVYDKPPRDIGVVSIEAPISGCLGGSETVTVRIRNFGGQAQDTIPVSYRINGGIPVSETVLVNIAPGDTLTYGFATTANLADSAGYVLDSWSELPGDTATGNDSTLGYAVTNNSTVADFTTNSTQNCIGSPSNFMDNSTNAPTSWSWDFGNGDTSSVQNPVYIFNAGGFYTVTLTVSNICNTDTEIKTNYIYISGGPKPAVCNPAVMDINNDIGIADVEFNTISNNTTGVLEAYTDYGCNGYTAVLAGSKQTLSVTTGTDWAENVRAWIDYNNDGAFDVTEVVLASDNQLKDHSVQFIVPMAVLDTLLRMRIASDYAAVAVPGPCDTLVYGQVEDYGVTITASTSVSEAEFTYQVQDLCNYVVQLTDQSTFFPTNWIWDFGDGSQDSGVSQVTHSYDGPGVYPVTMVVFNAYGSDTMIQVITLDSVVADFYIPDTVEAGVNTLFQNLSSGANAYNWNFGDLLVSNLKNPAHAYADTGLYTVALIATNSATGCVDTSFGTLYVKEAPEIIGVMEFSGLHFSVTPNPSDGKFICSTSLLNGAEIHISIISVLGEEVYSERLNTGHDGIISFNIIGVTQGVYLLLADINENGLESGSASRIYKKIVIQ